MKIKLWICLFLFVFFGGNASDFTALKVFCADSKKENVEKNATEALTSVSRASHSFFTPNGHGLGDKAPCLELNDEDLKESSSWDMTLLLRFDYGVDFDLPFRQIDLNQMSYSMQACSLFLHKRYIEAIGAAEKGTKKLFAPPSSSKEKPRGRERAVAFRVLSFIEALSLEFLCEWDDAEKIYSVLYGRDEEEFMWIRLRLLYSKMYNHRIDRQEFVEAFELLCRDAARRSSYLSVDSALKAIDDTFEEFNNRKPEERYSYDFFLPFDYRHPSHGLIFALYEYRSQCCKIVNPFLYYIYPHSLSENYKTVLLSRKSYKSFCDFMEEYYAYYIDLKPEMTSDPFILEGMEFLRSLKKLPY